MGNKSEKYKLKSKLSELGWETFKEWSEHFGYESGTVNKVITRHWRTGTNPYGETANNILSDLERTLREKIRRVK